jgi:hypothetical protein
VTHNDNDERTTTTDLQKGLRFVALESRVVRGSQLICRATSANLAKRIAKALNEHVTDRRGQ